ncbi:MAG: ABC transporter substrate-binding protein [Solirubrobacteraceae bacterium]|nr:ABC transporter substrate-binding protein [Solirubrobacteraceae bacterium]
MHASLLRRPLVPALLLLLALLSVLTLTACGDDEEPTAATGSGADAVPEKITIGYQAIPNGDLVVKHQQLLEKALPDTRIEWKQFDSGGSVNEAFAGGSLDIGLAGSSPVSRGLSQGIEYVVPWIHDVIGSAEALVAKDGIRTIADLKGKTIAAPLASTTHYTLLAALKDAGVAERDVKIIDAEPADIAAAWKRDDIDAAYVWNPTLATLVDDGGTVITDSAKQAEKGHTTYDLAVVSKAFADRYPDALATWVEQQDAAVRLLADDPDAAAVAIGAELNLEPAEVLQQTKGLQFLTADEQSGAAFLGGKVGRDLLATATFNKDVGQIPATKPDAVYTGASYVTAVKAVAGRAGR